MDLRDLLRQGDVYSNVDVGQAPCDLQGWVAGGFSPTFEAICDRAGGGDMTVLEVGTWKGASTNIMADMLKARGGRHQVLAIDTWLGSPEFWTPAGLANPSLDLQRKNGYPTIYDVFVRNVKHKGNEGIITPLPLPSLQAAAVLATGGVQADAIYVDASHEYQAVALDLAAFWPLLRAGGVMFGDDYTCAGVRDAVHEAAAGWGVETSSADGVVWSVIKPGEAVT